MNFTLRGNTVFQDGTTVYCYPGDSILSEGSGEPKGTAITSDVMTNGACLFTGLDPDSRYVAAAQVAGIWRHTGFRTDPISPSQGNFDASDDLTFSGEVAFTGTVDLSGADLLGLPPGLASQSALDAHTQAQASVHGIASVAALLKAADIGVSVAAQADSRFLTAALIAALVGSSGTPGSGNKFVTDQDARLNTDPTTRTWTGLHTFTQDPVFPSLTKIPQKAVADNYTIAVGDEGKRLVFNNNANPKTLTLPTFAQAAIPTDSAFVVWNPGTGTLTLVQGDAGNNAPLIRSPGALVVTTQYATIGLIKQAAGTFVVEGNLG